MSPTPEHLWNVQAEAQKETKKQGDSNKSATERLSGKEKASEETEEKLKKDIAQLDPEVLASMAKNGHLTLTPGTTVEDYIAMTQQHVEEPDKEPGNNEHGGNVGGSAQAFTMGLGAVDASLEVAGSDLQEKLRAGKIPEKTYANLVGQIDAYRSELNKLESKLLKLDKKDQDYA